MKTVVKSFEDLQKNDEVVHSKVISGDEGSVRLSEGLTTDELIESILSDITTSSIEPLPEEYATIAEREEPIHDELYEQQPRNYSFIIGTPTEEKPAEVSRTVDYETTPSNDPGYVIIDSSPFAGNTEEETANLELDPNNEVDQMYAKYAMSEGNTEDVNDTLDRVEKKINERINNMSDENQNLSILEDPIFMREEINALAAFEINDLGNNPVMQAEMDALAEQHDSMVNAEDEKPFSTFTTEVENEHEHTLKEVRDFYELLDMPTMGRNFDLMSTEDLKEHLYLLRTNNGGSFSMARLLQTVEMEYDGYLKSDTLRMRMSLVEQKAADFIVLAQKMRSIVGKDFVINGVRSQDYHNMLKCAVANVSVMHEKISAIGRQLGLQMPTEELRFRGDSVPIIEGMPADPRVAMYVLDILIAHLDKFAMQLDQNNKQLQRDQIRIKSLLDREKHLISQAEDALKYQQQLIAEAEHFRSNSSYWIIKDDKGRILRQVDDEKLVHTRQLDLRGSENDCLQFTNRTGAKTWAQRLMGTRRFYGRQLIVYRVSIVEEEV